MNKLLNLLTLALTTNLAIADGNVIKSSNSSDDPYIVMQVGTENIQLQEFEVNFQQK